MNKSLLALLFASLPLLYGCKAACTFLGSFIGFYTGDGEGDVTVEVSEVDDENVSISVSLSGDLSAFGEVTIACGTAGFGVEIVNNTGEIVGEVTGDLTETGAAGDWSTTDGLSGTWSAELADK